MPVGARELMIGWCHRGTLRQEFVTSLLNFDPAEAGPIIGRIGQSSAEAILPLARNELAAQFLAGPERWLLMVDTDIVFTTADVAALAGAADADTCPLLSGVVAQMRPDGITYPLVFGADRDEAGTVTGFAPILHLPGGGLIDADGCGAGFLLMHRRVLEAIDPGEWFWLQRTASGGVRGEDLSFCLRAAAAGFGLRVHCGVRPGHVKTVIVAWPGPGA